jgi:hypothetical protein
MGRPRVSDGPPLAIRLDAKTRERLEALRTALVPGLEVTLAQVVRAALTRGLDAMGAPSDFEELHTPPRQAVSRSTKRRNQSK